MKTLMLLFLILLTFIPNHNLTAQQNYVEQNSGVSVNLTSVCMIGFSASQVWVCGNNGTVLKTTNQGNNWISVGANGIPNNVNLVNINCNAFDTAITAGNIGSITYVYRTSNGGLTWSQVFTQANGTINAVWMKSRLLGFMCGNPVGGRWSLWKTTNGGVNWDSTGLFLPQNGSETGWNNSLEIINNNIWFGTNNSRIYYSSNYGSNWLFKSTAPEINSSSQWHYNSDTLFSFLGGANAYKTTNGGTNWTQLPCPGSGNFRGFCVGQIFVSNFPWQGPTFTVRGTGNIYINWFTPQFLIDYTAPAGNYNHIAYSNTIYAYNAPILSWAIRTNGGITRFTTGRGGAVNRISSEIPMQYSLKQNYPNPFNPVTKIQFHIPDAGGRRGVSLTIYDILGREVTVLVNEKLNPGAYQVDFDAANLSSGMYFYSMVAGDYSETKKMILIR